MDVSMDFDALKAVGAVLGSGAIIVLAEGRSIVTLLDSILRFFEHESCGKCIPCRVGTRHLVGLIDRLKTGSGNPSADIEALVHQSRMMAKTSLCPLGQSPILPIDSAVRYFCDEFQVAKRKTSGNHP